jgi:hypothetical protein
MIERNTENEITCSMYFLRRHLHLRVQKLRRQVRAVFPHYRLEFGIDAKLPKASDILQWCEDFPRKLIPQIDISRRAIVEADPDYMVVQILCLTNVQEHSNHSKGGISFNGRRCSASTQSAYNSR